jgi:LCP family protein required for cell wall assembly
LPLWGLGLLAVIAVVFLVLSAFWLFNTVVDLASDWQVTNPDFGDVSEPLSQTNGNQVNSNNQEPDSGSSIISNLFPEKWSGSDRVTILVLGIDRRCEEEGPTRTDSMMLLTMDPVGLSAAVLSLPRDLWVEIPGFGVDRINQAHFLGEVYDYPGGGPGLALETIEGIMGIDVNYYATIDFNAFVEFVDEIGGIDIEVPETIEDDIYPDNCYGYDPFYIDAGEHHLDGAEALKYARTRATFGGDVDRASRQQQVVMAVREKILSVNMVPQILTKAPELWRIFQENVETNLSLNEAIQLGLLAQDISSDQIRTEVLDYDYVYNELTPDGQAVLIPVRENIRALRDQLFAPPVIPTPVIEDLPEMMADEAARVAIYNGTQSFGLAAATQEYLLEQDISVVEIGNADSADYRSTQIIDYGSFPNTALYLAQIMDIPPLNISNSQRPVGEFDLLIILGNDWQIPGSESE